MITAFFPSPVVTLISISLPFCKNNGLIGTLTHGTLFHADNNYTKLSNMLEHILGWATKSWADSIINSKMTDTNNTVEKEAIRASNLS